MKNNKRTDKECCWLFPCSPTRFLNNLDLIKLQENIQKVLPFQNSPKFTTKLSNSISLLSNLNFSAKLENMQRSLQEFALRPEASLHLYIFFSSFLLPSLTFIILFLFLVGCYLYVVGYFAFYYHVPLL